MEVLLAYGGRCVCCGEANYHFLTLDHKNNDGARHRRENVNSNIYVWARRNDYPSILQVMCFNCNCAKAFSGLGHCPHEDFGGGTGDK